MNLDKPNIIKNFFFSLKKIYKKDKIFVFETIVHTIISALVVFMYPYILKMAIEAIEQNLSFKELILRVLIVIIIVMILVFINQACLRDKSYRARKLSALFTREYHLNSLKTDYEKFEQPESQDAFEKGSRALGTRSGFIGLYTNMFTTISKVITFIIGCGIILSVSIWLIVIIVILVVVMVIMVE